MFEIVCYGILGLIAGMTIGFGLGYSAGREKRRIDTYAWFKAGMDADRDYQRARYGEVHDA